MFLPLLKSNHIKTRNDSIACFGFVLIDKYISLPQALKSDDVFHVVLTSMEFENKIPMRRVRVLFLFCIVGLDHITIICNGAVLVVYGF